MTYVHHVHAYDADELAGAYQRAGYVAELQEDYIVQHTTDFRTDPPTHTHHRWHLVKVYSDSAWDHEAVERIAAEHCAEYDTEGSGWGTPPRRLDQIRRGEGSWEEYEQLVEEDDET